MRQKKIGFIDSGIGGFSILRELIKLGARRVDYIADDAFLPYGDKSSIELASRGKELTALLSERNCDVIVLACNTLTASVIEELRKRFKTPFVGVEPFINFINLPGYDENEKVACLCTPSLLSSLRFSKLRESKDPKQLIDYYSMPDLAHSIEKLFWKKKKEKSDWNSIRAQFKGISLERVDKLILGCTHYPLIENFLQKEFNLECISPGKAVASRVNEQLELSLKGDLDINILKTKVGYWEQFDPECHSMFRGQE